MRQVKFLSFLSTLIPIYSGYILNNTIILKCLKTDIRFISLFLKNQSYLQLKILDCITCVDFFTQVDRFELTYDFLSLQYNFRLTLKIYSTELASSVYSLTSYFPCAFWWEREIWDMFGIFFVKNFDLRRILTDYGFVGFPLRKDFPLSGFSELSYNFRLKTCFYSTIELARIPKFTL